MRQFRPKGTRKAQQRIYACCRRMEKKRRPHRACIENGIYRTGL